MTNIDLGSVIWLDVCKKLLSYHKWFFTKFDKIPKAVQAEFRHHSHTHPNTSGLTTGNDVGHACTAISNPTTCGYAGSDGHIHSLSSPAPSAFHTHGGVEVSFGSASLGSPNWWEHTHPITLVTINNGSITHGHGTTTSSAFFCSACEPSTHTHPKGTAVIANKNDVDWSHAHTITGQVTGNADSGDTPEVHSHAFTVTFNDGGSHTHTVSGSLASNRCAKAVYHVHSMSTPSTADVHNHGVAGTSGVGGEAAPPSSKAGLHPSKPLAIILGE